MSFSMSSLFIVFIFIICLIFSATKYPHLIIKLLKYYMISIIISSFILYLFINTTNDITNNSILSFLWMYSIGAIFICILPFIFIFYDIFYLIKKKDNSYLYSIIVIDILLPCIGIYIHNEVIKVII